MAAMFEIYKDNAGEFRWRLIDTNEQVIANSVGSHKTKAKVMAEISSVKENASGAVVEDKTKARAGSW